MEIPGFYYDPETKKYFKITRDKLVNPYAKQEFKKIKKARIEPRHEVFLHLALASLKTPSLIASALLFVKKVPKEKEQKKKKVVSDLSIVHKLRMQSMGGYRRPDQFTR